MLKSVKIKVPATTANCGPGFDCIGIACTLYNTLELNLLPDSQGIKLEVFGEGNEFLPKNDKNLAVAAIKKVLDLAGISNYGLHVIMHNDIPLSRGLGSSAAAVVAGLTAGNAVTGNKLSKLDLLNLAVEFEGHPDNVAPAIFGGITISFMVDGKANCMRIDSSNMLKLVAVIPQFTVATKKAREVMPKSVSMHDAVYNISRTALLVGCLSQNNFEFFGEALRDKLHQPYRQTLIPGMYSVFEAAGAAGANGAAISGSGSTLMAYTMQDEDRVGQAMVNCFKQFGIDSRYIVLNIDAAGVELIS